MTQGLFRTAAVVSLLSASVGYGSVVTQWIKRAGLPRKNGAGVMMMADGRLLPGGPALDVRFAADGKSVWINSGYVVATRLDFATNRTAQVNATLTDAARQVIVGENDQAYLLDRFDASVSRPQAIRILNLIGLPRMRRVVLQDVVAYSIIPLAGGKRFAAAVDSEGTRRRFGPRGRLPNYVLLGADGKTIGPLIEKGTQNMSNVFPRLRGSADGSLIAAFDFAGRLHAWNGATGAVIPLPPRKFDVETAFFALTPDGKRIVAGDQRAVQWIDVAARRAVVLPQPPGYPLRGVTFTPDGTAYGVVGDTLARLDTAGGTTFSATVADPGFYGLFAVSSDGRRAALEAQADHTGRPRFADLAAGVVAPRPVTFAPKFAGIAADGSAAVTCDPAGNLVRWDLSTNAPRATGKLPRGVEPLDLDFRADGTVVVLTARGTLSFDAPSLRLVGERLFVWPKDFVVVGGRFPAGVAVAMSRDGRQFALGDAVTGKVSGPFANETGGKLSISPDGKSAAAVGKSGVTVFDTASGTPRWTTAIAEQPASADAVFSDDGKTVVVRIAGPKVLAFDAASGGPTREPSPQLMQGQPARGDAPLRLAGLGHKAGFVICLEDGTVIATATGRGPGDPPDSPPAAPSLLALPMVAWLPNGRECLMASRDGALLRFDLAALLAGTNDLIPADTNFSALLVAAAEENVQGRVIAAAKMIAFADDTLKVAREEAAALAASPEADCRRWLTELSAADAATRDKAHVMLERNIAIACPLIPRALALAPAGETRERLESLARLAGVDAAAPVIATDAASLRRQTLAIALRWIDTPEARDLAARLSLP